MTGYQNGRDLPDWHMPPLMIGGYVTGPVLIERSGGCVVAVRQVLAYPVGVEIEVEAHARGASPGGELPADPMIFSGYSDLSFRVEFDDGTGVLQDDDAGLRTGRGPTLVVSRSESSSGGPDGHEDVRLSLWLWPLPPPGTFTLACSWPSRGVQGAGLVLDADAIRAAARGAQAFWPETS